MNGSRAASIRGAIQWRDGSLMLAALGGIVGGVLVLAGGLLGVVALMSCAIAGWLIWFGVRRPGALLMFSILVSATAGALRNAGSFEIDGVELSISGLSTGVLLLGTMISLLGNLRRVRADWMRAFLPFWIVSAIAIARSFGAPSVIEGLRDAVLITTPVVLAVLARLALEHDSEFSKKMMRLILLSPLFGAVAILGGLATDLVEYTSKGMTEIPGRAMSLYLLVVCGLALACWRQGTSREIRKRGLRALFLSVAIIVATLSRMATLIAVAVQLPLGLVRVARMRTLKITAAWVFAVCLLASLLQWPAMRQRYLGNLDIPLYSIGELSSSVPMTGRDKAWALTWSSALECPLFGHGTGSSRDLVGSTFTGLEHPHNEYLRVFHDMGLLGLLPFVWGWGGRIITHWRRWKSKEETGNSTGTVWDKAATVGGIGVALSFITDNALLYVFVTGPLFILFALADAGEPG